MKPKCFLLLVFLCVNRQILTLLAINESRVDNYVVMRRSTETDLFAVNMKGGHSCTDDGQAVFRWCESMKGLRHNASSNFESCSCTCNGPFRSFLPSEKTCINSTTAASFGGCQAYLTGAGGKLLQNSVNLGDNKNIGPFKVNANTCNLQEGHYFDYTGFQRRWLKVPDGIFSLQLVTQGKGQEMTFYTKWTDSAVKLSGRIIRLTVICNSSQTTHCILFKASGTVTYYSGPSKSSVNQSSYPAVPTSVDSQTPMSLSVVHSSPPPPPSVQLSPLSPLQTPSASQLQPQQPSLSSPPQSLEPSPSQTSSPSLPSLGSASTGILTLSPSTDSQTRSIHTRPMSLTGPVLLTSKTELQSSLPFRSEETSNEVVSTGIPNTIIIIKPSKSSLATKGASSTAAIAGPGNKEALTNGNDDGVVIGAAVGGAVVFGIFVITIIVFCRRRKLRKNTEKASGLEVKNPVYGSSDIPLKTTENQVKTFSEQDSQPTYQGLITNNGQINEPASHSSRDDNYDNYTVYQSLDKKKPGAPVYESLKKGQVATGKPNLSTTGRPRERPNVSAEPVYNVLEQPDAEQGAMPERAYGDPGHGNHGDTQDPLYNVLEGPDAEETYTAPDVGDPLYNVLEGPESRQGPQEPLYNVLESSDAENSSSKTQGPYDGANSEPLYNVLEEPDSDGPNKDGVGVPAPNGSTSPEAHDNPAYEQTLELNAPYASVHKPGSQRESVYEPLRGPERQDLYMPISKGRTAHT